MHQIKILLLILLFYVSHTVTAQAEKISGKLVMNYNSQKIDLPKKIYAILKYKNKKDSILLSDTFEFEFNNLPKDTFKLSFSIRNYPINKLYIIRPKDTENYKIEIPFTPVCPYTTSKKKHKCPTCEKRNQVIPISYGYWLRATFINKDGHEVDRKGKKIKPKKNSSFPGGCVITDCQPNWYCERDQTKF
jgi:hypothetical protein